MDTFAYLHLIQDYEDAESPQLQEHFGSLKQIHLPNSAKLGLVGILCGACSVVLSSPAQATDEVRASYAGGGYFYVFSSATVSGNPSSGSPSQSYPICAPDCPATQPVSVNPSPSVCTSDCSPSYVPISPDGVLKYGFVGAEVKALQLALREAGCYYGAIDGVFGKATHHAVVRFQRNNSLIPDGIVGSSTAQILGLV